MEGMASEASSLAGHLGLGRLIVFYDNNHISLDGPTDLSFSDDVGKRYEAYGWHVQDLGEDLALDRIEEAARAAMEVEDRPSLVILRTHIGVGSPNKQDTKAAHGSPLGEEEVELTKKAYGWPTNEPFYVPEDVLEHFRQARDRGAQLEEEWDERAQEYEARHPELWHQLKLIMDGAPARRVGRRHAALRPRRRRRGHAQGGPVGARLDGLQDPARDRGRGGPVLLHPHDDHGWRHGREERLLGPQRLLRRARARHGRDRQRPRGTRVSRARLDVPPVLGLHEEHDPAGGVDEAAVVVRLHARLDRPRRGRPHASARRAPVGSARYSKPVRRPAGGRERDDAGLALRHVAAVEPGGDRGDAPGAADPRPRRCSARRRGARRLCAAATRPTAPSRRSS